MNHLDHTQPTELTVIRHGETEWNVQRRYQGHAESRLTEKGRQQALAATDCLQGEYVPVIYSSDLGRAHQTAQIIAEGVGAEVTLERRLRERNFGCLQGLTAEEAQRKYPEDYALHLSRDADAVIQGAETFRQLFERTVECVEEIVARHAGQRVIIVAHGGTLDCLFRRTTGLPLSGPRTFSLFNGAAAVVEAYGGDWKLIQWGVRA